MGGRTGGEEEGGGPPSRPLSSPRPPRSILRHRPSSCGAAATAFAGNSRRPQLSSLSPPPSQPPPPLLPRLAELPEGPRGSLPASLGRGRRRRRRRRGWVRWGRLGVTAAAAAAAAGGVGGGDRDPPPSGGFGATGVEVEAGGCPSRARARVTPTPPGFWGAGERRQCAGGRGGGVPGLAVPCAACLGCPAAAAAAAAFGALLSSKPGPFTLTRLAARHGEGAAAARRGYVTRAAGGESVFGLGGGRGRLRMWRECGRGCTGVPRVSFLRQLPTPPHPAGARERTVVLMGCGCACARWVTTCKSVFLIVVGF